jgi:hypothetical protein
MRKNLLCVGVVVILGLEACFYSRIHFDVNGLPKCESDIAVDLVSRAVKADPANQLVGIDTVYLDNIAYAQSVKPGDRRALCRASLETNLGHYFIAYAIRKSDQGNYTVRVAMDGNLRALQ